MHTFFQDSLYFIFNTILNIFLFLQQKSAYMLDPHLISLNILSIAFLSTSVI